MIFLGLPSLPPSGSSNHHPNKDNASPAFTAQGLARV